MQPLKVIADSNMYIALFEPEKPARRIKSRIVLESWVEKRLVELIGCEIIQNEIVKYDKETGKNVTRRYLSMAKKNILLSKKIMDLAEEYKKLRVTSADALIIASGVIGGASVFVSWNRKSLLGKPRMMKDIEKYNRSHKLPAMRFMRVKEFVRWVIENILREF